MKKYKMIISFDLDGTLFDMDFENTLWFEEIPKLYSKVHGISLEEAKKKVLSAYNEIGDEDYRWYDPHYWIERFKLGKPWHEIVKDLKHKVHMYPETKKVLSELKKGNKLIVISNATRDFINIKMEVENLDQYFEKIFSVTSDFGVVKKDTDIYKKVCEIMKIKPEELVHVGDHYKFDYTMPRQLGVKAFILDRKKERKGEVVVHDLKEFKEKISRGLS